MSKSALKRARIASANLRLAQPVASTNVLRGKRACAVDAALTLKGNFERGPARQEHEAAQRELAQLVNVIEPKLPSPESRSEYDALVALVEARGSIRQRCGRKA